MKKIFNYRLEFVVFIVGLSIMILELVGSRILAPYLGTTIYVWTSLIGVILASLSLGYFLGGRIADKKASYRIFSLLILLAGIYIVLIALFKEQALNLIKEKTLDVRTGSVLASVIFFGIPNILLGMVSPYAVKLKAAAYEATGKAVGNLYAISTIGSIAGTFLAGFVLIPAMGSTKILFVVALTLIVISLMAYHGSLMAGRNIIFWVLGLVFVITGYFCYPRLYQKPADVVVETDTQYNHVKITDNFTGPRAMRLLTTGNIGAQSEMFLDNPDEVVFDYIKFYRMIEYFNPQFRKALMIGGAGYSFPKDYLKRFPKFSIDVVEIDPKLTQYAKDYFSLPDDRRLKIFTDDGRIYLGKTNEKYDAILFDAYQGPIVPFQLTTREMFQKTNDHLNDNGVMIMNVVSSLEGPKSTFLSAEYATLKSAFNEVYVFPLGARDSLQDLRNVMLVAVKNNHIFSQTSMNPDLNMFLTYMYLGKIQPAKILTDDFAPVENLSLGYAAENR